MSYDQWNDLVIQIITFMLILCQSWNYDKVLKMKDFLQINFNVRMNGFQFALRHSDELDGKVKCGSAGDSGLRNASGSVGQMRGYSQGSSLTLTHAGHSALVALDNLKWRHTC